MENNIEISIEDRIYEFITERGGGVSFVEIREEFGEGSCALVIPDNLVIFGGLRIETVDGVSNLVHEKRVLLYPTSPLLYLIDGCTCSLPLAKRPNKNGYKEPHWLPVVLWTIDQIKSGMRDGNLLTNPKDAAIYRDGGYDI